MVITGVECWEEYEYGQFVKVYKSNGQNCVCTHTNNIIFNINSVDIKINKANIHSYLNGLNINNILRFKQGNFLSFILDFLDMV